MVLGVFSLLGAVFQGQVFAETSYSDDYSVTETQFGSGSVLNSCSEEYCAKASAGDLGAGRSSSENYSSASGGNTSNEPTLDVTTTMNTQDLGVLDSGTTASTTAKVKVRTYLSDGYTIQINGNTPHMGTHHLTALSDATESQAGREQFGINLVDNSTPNVGADPLNVPENSYSTSMIKAGYNTPNQFKYHEGDVLAESNLSTGETDYTISMILNISNLTPGGYYTSSFAAVVTPTF
jgi:hypothetical protein